jgi:hypothetical protein
MKLAILLSTLLVLPAPAFSQQTNVFDECKRYIHKEQYLPGYYDNQGNYRSGRIKKYRERVPCNNSGGYQTNQSQRQQRVGCNRGSRVLSGLLGGGIAAAVSKSDAYAWSIPLGVVSGVALDRAGCP